MEIQWLVMKYFCLSFWKYENLLIPMQAHLISQNRKMMFHKKHWSILSVPVSPILPLPNTESHFQQHPILAWAGLSPRTHLPAIHLVRSSNDTFLQPNSWAFLLVAKPLD
jgi:hypothetical protein